MACDLYFKQRLIIAKDRYELSVRRYVSGVTLKSYI